MSTLNLGFTQTGGFKHRETIDRHSAGLSLHQITQQKPSQPDWC